MPLVVYGLRPTVICRVGSLEKYQDRRPKSGPVICRVGSLENARAVNPPVAMVICRVGSLENVSNFHGAYSVGYLPSR